MPYVQAAALIVSCLPIQLRQSVFEGCINTSLGVMSSLHAFKL